MIAQFEMTHMGPMSYFLGIKVKQMSEGIFISQKKYAVDVLKFKMKACNPIMTPVEERLKLEKEGGSDFVNPTTFRRSVGLLNSNKTIYSLWSWTYKQIYGFTTTISLASRQANFRIY